MKRKIKNKLKYILTLISPKLETKLTYRTSFKKKLDLKNPKTINEKILWLKLNTYNNNDLITMCADKYGIRRYLKDKGNNILIPKLYGVYDKVEEIDFENLPDSFVIKCNHGCGYNIIVPDKSRFDREEAIKKLKKWIKEDYWKLAAEIQYKYIDKKIIIEEFLGDVKTYKFYCFNGEPKVMYISNSEWIDGVCYEDKYIDYYDMEFKHIDCNLGEHPNFNQIIEKPNTFDEMVEKSRELSSDFPFVRVDLYECENKVYMSELTFIPTAGFMKIRPSQLLDTWGDWLDLSDLM